MRLPQQSPIEEWKWHRVMPLTENSVALRENSPVRYWRESFGLASLREFVIGHLSLDLEGLVVVMTRVVEREIRDRREK